MKEFKFRGRTKTGKFVYGDLIHKGDSVQIRTDKSYRYHEVDPESVCRLVGRDYSGAEIYESDTLENDCGDTFIVSVHVFPVNVGLLKLKEASE